MKQVFFSTLLLLGLPVMSKAQTAYSRYNGETWQQIGGSGKLVQLKPTVQPFSILELSHMNVQVRIETGAAEYSLHLSIDDNLKDFFRYQQQGNTLKLSFDLSGGKYKRWLSSNNTVVTVKVPILESLINNGNTDIALTEINQKIFRLVSSGNSAIVLSGMVNEFTLQSTGNSEIDAGAFVAQKTILRSSGNSEIVVNTKELIEEKVNGNTEISNLYYKPTLTAESKKEKTTDYISFALKNKSIFSKKITVISYRPDEKGNGTNVFVLIPYSSKRFRFPVGTKLYIANEEQVNTVMSGAGISDQPPFLIVKKEDNHQTFLIKE